MARGRPSSVEKNKIIDVLLKYKGDIVQNNEKIISKLDAIWIKIANELENNITPMSLYTLVTCNRYKIREKLCGQNINSSDSIDNVQDTTDVSSVAVSTMGESTVNESEESFKNVDGVTTFTITMPKADFNAMIISRRYRRKEKNRPLSTRQYQILQKGTWQHVFSKKIWECAKLPCGFNFKRHKLYNNGEYECIRHL